MTSSATQRPVWMPEPADPYPSHGDPPLTDTDVQRLEREAVSQILIAFFEPRPDVYASADLFVYYEEGRPEKKLAPDVFVCFGVSKRLRTVYKTWEEDHGIDWALEIVSSGTWRRDLIEKAQIYGSILHTREYYVFDPEGRYLPQPLMGFELRSGVLAEQEPSVSGRFHSPLLGLELGLVQTAASPLQRWELHVYRPDGERILRSQEAVREAQKQARRAEDQARLEARARAEAEERARQDAAQRAALEEMLRQTREELARLRQGSAPRD
jgi:Uma2 family endonuclease